MAIFLCVHYIVIFCMGEILENFLYGVLCNIFLCVRIHSKFFVCVHYIVIFCMGKNVWQSFVWQFFVCVYYITFFCMGKNVW